MSTRWLVNIIDKPLPKISNPTSEQSRLIALWSEFFPPHPEDGYGDFEDYFEQAVRLDAALNSFGRDYIHLITSYKSGNAKDLATGKMNPYSELLDIPRFGEQEKNASLAAPHNISLVSERRADRYMSSPAFIANSGRKMVLTGNHAGEQDIYRDVYEMAQQGVRRIFIKTAETKKGIWQLDIDDTLTTSDIRNRLLTELDWTLIRYEEVKNAFLVQEFVQMNYEYRLFVVDGSVVTASGCIEEYTPLNNRGNAFDEVVRHTRIGNPSPVEFLPEVTAELVEFGSAVAKEMAAEEPEMYAFTLDVAMDKNGIPLVIERNGMLNAGLYASQPQRVSDALAQLAF